MAIASGQAGDDKQGKVEDGTPASLFELKRQLLRPLLLRLL